MSRMKSNKPKLASRKTRRPKPKRLTAIQSVAYHEVGHAIVSELLGLAPVHYVEVFEDGSGHTVFEHDVCDFSVPALESEMVRHLAGSVAQSLAEGGEFLQVLLGSGANDLKAFKHMRAYVCRAQGLDADDLKMYEDDCARHAERARELLLAYWSTVVVLAEIVAFGSLMGDDMREIMARRAAQINEAIA